MAISEPKPGTNPSPVRACFAVVSLVTTIVLTLALVADYDISLCRTSTTDVIEEIPRCHAALVLGTSRRDARGHENGYFTHRIDAAFALWSKGKADVIIVSGDNGHRGYDEPTEMMSALVDMGMPASAITCDFAGFRTLDSVVRLRAIFGQETAIVVSQQFHNERAIYIAAHHNITLYGLNAQDVGRRFGLKTRIREFAARIACIFDIHILHTGPRFYGVPIKL